jgi:hypothetical protein
MKLPAASYGESQVEPQARSHELGTFARFNPLHGALPHLLQGLMGQRPRIERLLALHERTIGYEALLVKILIYLYRWRAIEQMLEKM